MFPIHSQLFFPLPIQNCRFLSLLSATICSQTACLTSYLCTLFSDEVCFTIGSLKNKYHRRKSTLPLNITFDFSDTKEQSPMVGLGVGSQKKKITQKEDNSS
jgi:hypothetical protein